MEDLSECFWYFLFSQLFLREIGCNLIILNYKEHSLKVMLFSLFSNRTPAQFLHEIVLVDDKSELQHLHEPLDEELRKPYYQGKVKVVRNQQREGLIRARNVGAIAATGDFSLFVYSV